MYMADVEVVTSGDRRGYCVLGTSQGDFTSTELWDPRIHSNHKMMLAVIRGKGVARNRIYQWGRTQCPIQRVTCGTQPKRDATSNSLKDEVYSAPRQIWLGQPRFWHRRGIWRTSQKRCRDCHEQETHQYGKQHGTSKKR